jgi:hypothetical protein
VTTTSKLALELLANAAANQTLANTTFAQLNQLVQPAAVDRTNAPPGSPVDEALYIITATATGAWAGKENQLAYWLASTGAWQYIAPREGMLIHVNDENVYYKYDGSVWGIFSGGGGSVSWGDIGGTLLDQTDLQSALDQKLDDAPSDGTSYVRKDGAWVAESGGGGGGGSFDRLSTLTASEVAVSSGATLTSTAFGKMHICSGASDYTLVLPTASGNAGKIIGFRAARSAAAFITIDGSGSETVDGKSAFVIRAGEVLTLLSDGTNFEILDYRHCKVFAAATRTAVQTIAGVVFTKVQLNVIEGSNGNVGGAFDTTTYRFTAKRTRRHRVLGNLSLTAVGGVNDALSPRIYVNGSQVRFGGYSPSQVSTIMGASFAADLQLSAGDYVELFVYNHFNANRGIPADFAGCCNMTIEEGAE